MQESNEQVQDIDEAEAGAYAQKPFMDAVHDYQKDLNTDQIKGLRKVATSEGDKAMAAHQEAKLKTDPKITLIKEDALKKIQLDKGFEDYIINSRDEGDKQLPIIKELLLLIGGKLIDNILSKQIDLPHKSAALQKLSNNILKGLRLSMVSAHPFINDEYKNGDENSQYFMLFGILIGQLVFQLNVEDVFKKILTAQTQISKTTYIDHIEILSAIKNKYPDLASAKPTNKSGDSLDEELKRVNFIWSDEERKYLSLKN